MPQLVQVLLLLLVLKYQSTQVDEQAVELSPEQMVQFPAEGTELEGEQVDVELEMQLPLTKVKVEQSEVLHS